MYKVVEFKPTSPGALKEVGVINIKWMAAKGNKVYWPPYRTQDKVDKACTSGENPVDNWTCYEISRVLYSTDDYKIAKKKERDSEVRSDVGDTDNEELVVKKREFQSKRTYEEDSSSTNSENDDTGKNTAILPSVPPFPSKKPFTSPNKRKENPASLSPNKRKENPASPSPNRREENPASPSSNKRKEKPASPSPNKRKEKPASPSPNKRKEKPASSSPNKRKEKPASPSPNKRKEKPASPSPNKRKEKPASSSPNKCKESDISENEDVLSRNLGTTPASDINPNLSPSLLSSEARSVFKSPKSKTGTWNISTRKPSTFDEPSYRLLQYIKKGVDLNTSMLNKLLVENYPKQSKNELPEDIELPLNSVDKFEYLETFISSKQNQLLLISYLGGLGGKGLGDCVRRIFAGLMTDTVAKLFNWEGRHGKRPFKDLKLKDLLINSVRSNLRFKEATESDVEKPMKEWLKQASTRLKRKSIHNETVPVTGDDHQ